MILRLWKIFRAAHAIAHALQLHYSESESGIIYLSMGVDPVR